MFIYKHRALRPLRLSWHISSIFTFRLQLLHFKGKGLITQASCCRAYLPVLREKHEGFFLFFFVSLHSPRSRRIGGGSSIITGPPLPSTLAPRREPRRGRSSRFGSPANLGGGSRGRFNQGAPRVVDAGPNESRQGRGAVRTPIGDVSRTPQLLKRRFGVKGNGGYCMRNGASLLTFAFDTLTKKTLTAE